MYLDGRRRNRPGEPESKHEAKTKGDVRWDEGHVPRERTKLTSSTTQLGGVAVILPVNVAAADACFFGRAGCQLRAGGPVPMTDIWEAGEVWRSHQMGMRCRCGVLAMIWGTELTPSCQKPMVCVTRYNRGATRAKSARQEPSQGHLPCSCRADYTGLLCSRSLLTAEPSRRCTRIGIIVGVSAIWER